MQGIQAYHIVLDPPTGPVIPNGSWRLVTSFDDAKRKICDKHPGAMFDDTWQILIDKPDRRMKMMSAWGAEDSAEAGNCVAYIRRMTV
jgi:hypothetical protein